MIKLIICRLLILAFVLYAVEASADELVINGNFETGDMTGWTFTPDTLSETKMFTYIQPFMDSLAFRVNPGSRHGTDQPPRGGVLWQTIPLVAGQTYQVSIGTLSIQNYGGIDNAEGGTITVSLGGSVLHTFNVGGIFWNETLTDSFTGEYIADTTGDALLELHFARFHRNSGQSILHWADDVSVIPEPACVGIVSIGSLTLLRRRIWDTNGV